MRRRLLLLFAAIVATLAIVALNLASLDDAVIRRTALAMVNADFAGAATVENIDIGFWPRPRFVLHRVSVANPPGYSRDLAFAADSIDGTFALWPLLLRRLVIDRLSVSAPRLGLEVNADGQANWRDWSWMTSGRTPTGQGWRLAPSTVDLRNARLELVDQTDGSWHLLELDRLELVHNRVGQPALEASGRHLDRDFSLRVSLVGAGRALDGESALLKLEASLGSSRVAFAGTVAGLPAAPRLVGDLNLSRAPETAGQTDMATGLFERLALSARLDLAFAPDRVPRQPYAGSRLLLATLLGERDVDIALTGGRLDLGWVKAQDLALAVTITRARLLPEGRDTGPTLRATRLNLEASAKPVEQSDRVFDTGANKVRLGPARISVDLAARAGDQPRALAELAGAASLEIGPSQIGRLIVAHGSNRVLDAVMPWLYEHDVTKVGHLSLDLTIADGVVESRDLTFDSDRAMLRANGWVDLRNRMVHVEIRPANSDASGGGDAVPMVLSGPLDNLAILPVGGGSREPGLSPAVEDTESDDSGDGAGETGSEPAQPEAQ